MISMSADTTRRTALLTGSAIGLAVMAPGTAALAQAPAANGPTQVSGVQVPGSQTPDYKVAEPSLPKLTQPILDTPQQIETVSRQLLDDRNATTLSDALRNASGVSLGAGESSWQGTNLTLRGFNARNDMYLDGMRDFGSYYRDPFALEEVEVLEGPSSMLFGRGSTGGVINQVTKTPNLTPRIETDLSLGTDDTRRLTADINEPIPQLGQGAAFRLNLMGNYNQVAGASSIPQYQRWGLAPSLALGLGTPTRLTFSYFHQSEDDIPDIGIPWYLGKPAPVPRDSYYGFSTDFLHTQADAWTVKAEHDYGSAITIRDQVRYAQYEHSWRQIEPQPVTPVASNLANEVVNRALQGSNSREMFFQNQTDLTARFSTGALAHTLAAGAEFGPERSSPEYDNALGVPATLLLTPNQNQTFSGNVFPRIITDTKAFTYAFYAIDTVKLGQYLELTGGVRWDSFYSDYVSRTYSNTVGKLGTVSASAAEKRTDQMPSYRGGVVFKPTANGSVYFDYSTSFDPSAEGLSQLVAVRSLNQGNLNLAPEKNQVYEVGTKWQVLDDRLLLQGAVFREEKENARVPDPSTPGFNILGGDQRVDGFELQGAGHITDAWDVHASYTYLHSEVIKSAPGGPAVGEPLFNAPDNSANLWTSYAFTKQFGAGFGVTYMGRRYGQNTVPIEIAPGYTTFDAMLKYQITPNLRAQVNLYNLTDKYYADELHGFHIVPGAGRSALFSVAAAF